MPPPKSGFSSTTTPASFTSNAAIDSPRKHINNTNNNNNTINTKLTSIKNVSSTNSDDPFNNDFGFAR